MRLMENTFDLFRRFLKVMISYPNNFIKEYITNWIINHIPIITLRMFYYRHVLSIKMDETVLIQMGCYLYSSKGDFSIGKNTIINRNTILDRRGGLSIGSNVNISAEVAIYTAGHDPQSPDFNDFLKPVIINHYVWIGTRAMIMPGVVIGQGAVILPGAVVTHNVEPYDIVGGTPARKLGKRNNELKYELAWRGLFT